MSSFSQAPGLGPDEFAFVAQVGVRWSDMDAFGHINHARMVTLLEEARIQWLLAGGAGSAASGPNHADATDGPASEFAPLIKGAMIVQVDIRYQSQLRHDDSPLQIGMWIKKFRSVDFIIGYEVRSAHAARDSKPACVASTQMAVVDIEAQKLKRLTPEQKAYLRAWTR